MQKEYVYCPISNDEGVIIDTKSTPDGRMILIHWPHSGRIEWRREASMHF